MKTLFKLSALLMAGASLTNFAIASDARVDSWMKSYSSKYARIYTNDAAKTAGNTVTTWSNGSQSQTLPAYCGVQGVYTSSNYVYIYTTGLGSHNMGPWYNDATRTTLFVNMPSNQKAFARFPRTPVIPTTKTASQGDLGFFVDGVRMFDASDATSYSNANSRDGDAPGSPNGVTGDGLWNRDAYINESITFDPALAHQQNTGVYHYHANPIATRYLLSDHVDYNSSTKAFTESTNAPTKHSPIVGWIKDGFPLYGPYGYSNPTNPASGVRRMVSGFVLRNGSYGTSNLTVVGRKTLPAWAARAYNTNATLSASQYGPTVGTSFPLGRYLEDNDYLGDLGYTAGADFDLDEYNCRWCVTPEFPNGTYAYFVAITTNGTSAFPYNVGRRYFGTPNGGAIPSLTEAVTTNFTGGANISETLNRPARSGNNVVLTWTGVEGGTYRVDAESSFAGTNWVAIRTNTLAGSNAASFTETNGALNSARFYRVARTAVATYDGGGGSGGGSTSVAPGGSASIGSTVTVTITLPTGAGWPPMLPPANAPITSVTLAGTVAGTSVSDATQGTVIATFYLAPGTSTGPQPIVIVFNMGPTYNLTGYFTVNP